ncbi:recombinase family protein [Planomicrobium sp. MB-3u-38]|uniref:recombinase family protein n=1 Tax=Planomicrobium sp. MB-3u-38 TaxID=2058318 RepID=UPI000C7D77FD|nr:recombinase family protein [Planomicrobium sp. MB-3u-38]PKH11699.1 resolvase [Planomicrobium sp. MB-3u-38]
MLIGYARPSLEDPACQQQLSLLKQTGCSAFYTEEHASPKKRERLQELLEKATSGDQVVVAKLYTWADSTRHLIELLDALESKGVSFYSLYENIEIGTGKEYSFTNILRNLADFQSDAISEKTKAGLSVAKEKGAVSGRPRKPDENVKKAMEMHHSKRYSLAEIKETTGISKSTLYRYLES